MNIVCKKELIMKINVANIKKQKAIFRFRDDELKEGFYVQFNDSCFTD